MKSKGKRVLSLLLVVALTLSILPAQVLGAHTQAEGRITSAQADNYLKLWYDEPATNWKTQALPIGNGNLGGMVFGKTDTEILQVNEITLWSGGPNSSQDYTGGNTEDAWKGLDAIQEKLLAGEKPNVKSLLGNGIGWNGYQNLGQFSMAFTGKANTSTTPEDYRRELDLNDGVARVSYTNEGVAFTREYFASNPGNVMVVRLKAAEDDALAFTLKLQPDTASDGYSALSKTFKTTAENGVISCLGEVTASKMKFAVQMKVIADGATITENEDGTISLSDGEDVVLIMSAGTNYDIDEHKSIQKISDFHESDGRGDFLDNEDPTGERAMEAVAKRVDDAAQMTYDAPLKRHMEDYCPMFEAASL